MKIIRDVVICLIVLGASSLDLGACHASETGIEPQGPWKIVNYWSKTCAPCLVEIPELNYLNDELAPFNVVVLGVNFDEDTRLQTMTIAERMGINFPTLTQARVQELKLTAPSVLPTTYILSPSNEVMAKLIGAQDRVTIKAKLAELFRFEPVK